MEKAEYVDRVAIREKVCTGCTMLVDGVCCDADPCENLIAGFLEEPPADVVPAHRKENAHSVPLTLDELRKMDGEPVWIVEYPDWGHWELAADAADYVADRDEAFYGMKHNDPAGRYGLHKLGWLAYCQKPEAVGHD